MPIIFVVGAPGAGKGTLCTKLAKEIRYYHLSVGDYLRRLVQPFQQLEPDAVRGDMSFQVLTQHVNQQKLLDAETIIKIIQYKIELEKWEGADGFIIDGFPRTKESAEMFNEKGSHVVAIMWILALM